MKAAGRLLRRRERGATLVEIIIAVVVLGLILMAVPPVLLVITHAQFTWNEQRAAEALTRNQVEYLKVTPYLSYEDGEGPYTTVPLPDETYRITLDVVTVDPGEDDFQKITIAVEHADRLVLETDTFKVDRTDLL